MTSFKSRVIFSSSGPPCTLVYLKDISELGFNVSIVLFIEYYALIYKSLS